MMLIFLVIGLILLPEGHSVIQPHDDAMRNLFYHTGTCNTQHARDKETDPDYYSSNSGMPHDPSGLGFMATHGTHRFVAMHEQTALLVGEGKHGVWRFQENGFIRVYRGRGKKGVPEEKKEMVLIDVRDLKDIKKGTQSKEQKQTERLLEILSMNYKNIDPNHKFDYAFGDEVSEEGWLNWIDLPIYHPKFGDKYDDHVPIELPLYYCQMSSADFPHMGVTWHIMKAQPRANEVGPLGKRAGVDVRENFNDVIRFHRFPDAGVWANIGQGNPDTDKMPKTLRELTERAQTVNWQRIDLEKIDIEVYIMERSYHNAPETYLSMLFVMEDTSGETHQTYIRPDGKYYEGLMRRNHAIKNTVPDNFPSIPIEGEAGAKQVYGLAAYGHHHMARIASGLTGGGCPNKGGDVSVYPWGDAGSGWPTNYEEITPLCDGFVIDIKTWANLDRTWNDDGMFLGNAGHEFGEQTEVIYQAHANFYGRFTDPWNAGKINPYTLDLTEDHRIQENPGTDFSAVPVVDFTIDFGKIGKVNDYVNVELDLTERQCIPDELENKFDGVVIDEEIVKLVNHSIVDSDYMHRIRESLFNHTGACNTQHGRERDDPYYYHSNSGMPHDPSSSGFMATHGTHRFMSMHEQTALLVGDGKHGVWRFQENGFIRVYREQGREGVPVEKKEMALVDLRDKETAEQDDDIRKLLEILEEHYMNIDPKYEAEFNYTFGDVEVSKEGWLNWIDLPIYHPKFGDKYDDHVPIELPLYYCQMSSPDFPHMGVTWHMMKVQPTANKVGPLGKRAGIDIRENFNDVIRFHLFDDAGVWANIGQGNPETDMMPKTLEELRQRVHTVNWQRVDLNKVDIEVYVMERSYHNAPETYLSMLFVMEDTSGETHQTYIRPDGKYYEGLMRRNHAIKNTMPDNFPSIPIEGEAGAKQVYGLATFGHHHMNRVKLGLTGGGCPNKGGDVSGYPWGDAGSGWPTNYEEITPLCDGFLIDIKSWVNLDKPWSEDDMFLGNAGNTYTNQTQVLFQAHANFYGRFTDPYNEGKTNPHEMDMTEDHEIQQDPGTDTSEVPVVNFTIDFGKVGEVNEFNAVILNLEPRQCLKPDEECIMEINAAFNHPTEKYGYVISRDTYVRLEADDSNLPVVSAGYPLNVAEQWPGIEGVVDAAFTDYNNGKTFFFVKSEPRRKVYCWNWNESEMEMDGEDEGSTAFAGLPQGEIKGMASYREYVVFMFENEYYLWISQTGLHEEAQTWASLTGDKSVHVSGEFDAFLSGYFHTGSQEAVEKHVLVRVDGDKMVKEYSYRRYEENSDLQMCA